MDKSKVINYIETSFLQELINNPEVTDISYNGVDIYYVSNIKGRIKSDIVVEHGIIKDFIRQIANLCEAQFSFTNPNLDLSVGRFRINATHQSIGRVKDEGVITFDIRLASSELRINDNSDFFTPQIVSFIRELLNRKYSIVIGGVTSSGKTEFQKYLLSQFVNNERILVIDNVLELDSIRNEKSDLTIWKSDNENEKTSASTLIKNALRNNPDWLILAEARGEEMVDVLNSAMTGIPLITTIHALDVESMPYRMGRMMMKSRQKLDYKESLEDIYYHFHYYFYLKKELVDGKIKRYIAQIAYVDNQGNMSLLFEKNNNEFVYYEDLIKFIDAPKGQKERTI